MSATNKKPSLYARKLLEKLRTLNPNASLESRQAIAIWMVFNRKKAEGMGEGLLLAIAAAEDEAASAAQRLMLYLKVLHQVFIEGKDDTEAFEKSSRLRAVLADVALTPLFGALAKSCSSGDKSSSEYPSEVKEMIETWRETNAFDGPTIWEGYKKAWGRALADNANEDTDVAQGDSDAKETPPAVESSTDQKSNNDVQVEEEASTPIIQTTEEITEKSEPSSSQENIQLMSKEDDNDTSKQKDLAGEKSTPPTPTTTTSETAPENDEPESRRRPSKRDSMTSVASIDIDFDAEGVEEAEVEPAKFLEASKVIASLQIARDLGSDAAMNLSSALGSVPDEVEQACNTIYAKQQEGGEEGATSIEELLSTEQLSNLPDEVLDIDLDYARRSLQTYREAILQQRKARLQCLQLLLQSRCSFGSIDAARAFGCDDSNDKDLNNILEQLKKVKDKLIDAMALEGLDVEENDADEKRMKEEEAQLKPLDWFPGQKEGTEEEPASKKQKVI